MGPHQEGRLRCGALQLARGDSPSAVWGAWYLARGALHKIRYDSNACGNLFIDAAPSGAALLLLS